MNSKWNPLLCLAFVIGTAAFPIQAFDDEIDLFGDETTKIKADEVIPPSRQPAKVTIPIKPGHDAAGFNFTLNFPGQLRVHVDTESKVKKVFGLSPASQTMKREPSKEEKAGKELPGIVAPDEEFPNYVLRIYDFFHLHGFVPYTILPTFKRYGNDYANKNIFNWEKNIPNALKKNFRLDLSPGNNGINVFIDSRFIGCLPGGKTLKAVRITGGQGPTITKAASYKNERANADWQVLDFGEIGTPNAMKDAEVSLKKGFQKLNDVPMIVSDGARSGDVSLVRAFRGMDFESEYDVYLSRSAFERMPESFLASVPVGYYSFAHVLFALDPDPAKKRVLTLRLTRFCEDGRGNGLAHTEIKLPDDDSKFPDNIKKVGSVKQKKSDGQILDIPLYVGVFPVHSGDILDIITNDPHPRRTDYLDFEVFGERSPIGTYYSPDLRPSGAKSAFNIFGLTLQKSPLWIEMKNAQVGNIFHNDETPETTISMRAERKSDQLLKWTIADTYGNPLKHGEQKISFAKKGESKEVRIPLDVPDIGHYNLKIELIEKNITHFTHNAMFAVLGPDTRLASPAESPFGSWWTQHHHGTMDPDIFMKIFNKAGIRRTNLGALIQNGVIPPKFLEAKEKYKMTLNQIPWNTETDIWNDVDPDVAFKSLEAAYDDIVKAFPECKYALVYHETYGDPLVPESYGIKVLPPSGRERGYTSTATHVANYFRKKHPHVKLVYGNNTSSAALTAALIKCDFPRDYFDFIGIETPGQGCIPERLFQGGTQGTWFAKEAARTYGFDAKTTGCYEFTCRPARLMGLHTQAEYLMRDALIGLAHGYETLGISGLNDPGGWYNPTLWGDGSLCMRNSLFYPKPVYVAYAAMTRVLDQIKFGPKILDTGSGACYALEFQRKRGDLAYAFWIPDGKGELRFSFPKDVKAEYVDFFGKTTAVTGKDITIPVSSAPGYLISATPADNVHFLRLFSERPAEYKTVAPLHDVADLRHIAATSTLGTNDIFRKTGSFELKNVKDDQQGDCIEISLKKEGELHPLYAEYTRIEFKKPILLEGKPHWLGLWVKGDGGWGKIGFEFRDARGVLFRSEGNWLDFAGRSYISFSGWKFMQYPIEAAGAPHNLPPQSLGGRWTASKGGAAQYPLTLTAVYITLRRKTLNPAEMVDVPAVIRIKDLSVKNYSEDSK